MSGPQGTSQGGAGMDLYQGDKQSMEEVRDQTINEVRDSIELFSREEGFVRIAGVVEC